jgi:hypothetical protein
MEKFYIFESAEATKQIKPGVYDRSNATTGRDAATG